MPIKDIKVDMTKRLKDELERQLFEVCERINQIESDNPATLYRKIELLERVASIKKLLN